MRSSARSTGSKATRRAAGSSTPSTGRRTTRGASRSGRRSSRSRRAGASGGRRHRSLPLAPLVGRARRRSLRGSRAACSVSAVERVEDAVLSFPLDRAASSAGRARLARTRHRRLLGAHARRRGRRGRRARRDRRRRLGPRRRAGHRRGGGRALHGVHGEPRIDSGTAVTSNGLLHDDLLAAFAEQVANP